MARYPRHLVERLTLADGSRLLLRPLLPSDWRGLQRGVARLTPEDRRLRFLSGFTQMSEAAAKRLCRLDFRREMALALFDRSARPPEGVGIARLAPTGEPGTAEIAIALLAPWRRRGLGRLLLQRLIGWAEAAGYRRLEALMLPENQSMRALAQSLGFRLGPSDSEPGLIVARLDLPGPGPAAGGDAS